jgi:hypothetical protein
MTHFIRFPDEVTGMKALDDAGLLDGDLQFITASHNHALDVIGEILGRDGWHVNYSGEIPERWEQYVVQPTNPVRIWF